MCLWCAERWGEVFGMGCTPLVRFSRPELGFVPDLLSRTLGMPLKSYCPDAEGTREHSWMGFGRQPQGWEEPAQGVTCLAALEQQELF